MVDVDYSLVNFMSLSLNVRGVLAACSLAAMASQTVQAQSGYLSVAGEYAVAGSLAGDQVYPQASLKPSGGYVVWQDNATDGDGWGVSMRRLDGSFSPQLMGNQRVNVQGVGDQEYPQVSVLNDGGAAFVWQDSPAGIPHHFQNIYARFFANNGTWLTGDIQVNTFTNDDHATPVVATLASGKVVVAWGSYNQPAVGSMQDVYFQLFTSVGVKTGNELLANQFTTYNQRKPAVAALGNGGFVLTWVSEQQTAENRVDVYARLFNDAGIALGNEFIVNTGTNVCANPSVIGTPSGGFAIAWDERDQTSLHTNSLDIYARTFSSTGFGGSVVRVNAQTYGDQYSPKISFDGGSYLVVWTSLQQDGSGEGVYGRILNADGSTSGGEFRVNSTTANDQMQPTVASDGASRFLTVWSGYIGGVNSFDLFAQRYATPLQTLVAPGAPFITAPDMFRLQVAWPDLAGFNVANYEVYADGATTPTAVVTSNVWWMTSLSPHSTHTFRLAYVLTDGRRSPLSAIASGTTWNFDNNFDGLPDDWQTLYWGTNSALWPSPNADSDGDGVNNRDEFLAGTDPKNANSVLRVKLSSTPQGLFLLWNTQPGLVYQLQTSGDMNSWTSLGSPRFAGGTNDSVYVGGNNLGYYRVLRLR